MTLLGSSSTSSKAVSKDEKTRKKRTIPDKIKPAVAEFYPPAWRDVFRETHWKAILSLLTVHPFPIKDNFMKEIRTLLDTAMVASKVPLPDGVLCIHK